MAQSVSSVFQRDRHRLHSVPKEIFKLYEGGTFGSLRVLVEKEDKEFDEDSDDKIRMIFT